MQKVCKACGSGFEVTDDDLAFYEKVSPVFGGKKYNIPPPTHCPECRLQRRYVFRNERRLYQRTCAKTGESIISIYHPESPHTIYSAEAWWGDDWDVKSYGRDVDWSLPFFEQFAALYRALPHLALINVSNENCDYVNQCGWSKNCYMAFITDFCEDCYYTDYCFSCRSCMDSTGLHDSELCYGCTDCTKCYTCLFCQDCSTCTDIAFCSDCKSCKNCFGCTGLRNKEHHLFNEPVSAVCWQEFLQNFEHTSKGLDRYASRAREIRIRVPHPHAVMVNCTDCTGNYLTNCKNTALSFDGKGIEDSRHCAIIPSSIKTSYDITGGGGELLYEGVSTGPSFLTRFTIHCWQDVTDLLYCAFCMNNSKNLFGCVGLRRSEYCILNRQYTREEYEQLVPQIIEHMRNTGEWGEFFPVALSPFAYNETVAQEYFPLTKEEVLKRGWKWRDQTDEIPKVEKIIPTERLPDSIDDIPDDILNWAIMCEVTGRPFRIIKQELAFYRKMRLPLPRLHPDERHRRRMALRNPRKLWSRKCDKCGKEIQTTYSPDRPETVYCESCYLREVY